MLFIPKGKSQLLRDKIKAKVRETPTGSTLADFIDDLNPVITGWRNYYRYATRATKEFAEHDWWLYWRLKSWLGKKHSKASAGTLRRIYAGPRTGECSGWRMGGKQLAQFADATRLRYPDRGLRIPNGWNATPNESLPKGSRQVLGGNPRPRFTVRATRGSQPRMESRMWGNSHVRFGAGDEETCPGNGARRFIPTLPVDPALLSL